MIEPSVSPVWATRIAALSGIMTKPMTVGVLQVAAQCDLGWEPIFTTNVLAAGEGRQFFTLDGKWRRVGVVAKPKPERPKRKAPDPIPPRGCKWCAQEFRPRIKKQEYCSGNCRQAMFKATRIGSVAA